MSESSELLGPGTWVQQGPATLIVREAGWVVLVPGTRKEVIEAAWTVLGDGPTGEAFLDQLVETAELDSADKLPAILFGLGDGGSVTYGVKGTTPIAVYTPDGSQLVAGTDEEPFVLRTFEEVRRTAFGDLPAEESLGAPRLESGITRVRGFVHMSMDPAQLDDQARQDLAEQVDSDGRSIEDPATRARRAEKPAVAAPKPATPASSAPLRTPSVAARGAGEMPSSLSGGRPSTGAAATPAADAGPSVFDGLFADQNPAPAAEPAPAAAATREPAGGRHRLVSTSLFDRKRQAPPTAPPPAQAPGPAATEAGEVERTEPGGPSASENTPSASIPTPDPPDEDADSQVTLIAPIDHGEGPEEDSPSEPPGPIAVPEPTDGVASSAPAPDVGGSYDDLFGQTIFRRIEDAAVRRTTEDDEPHEEPSASASASAPPEGGASNQEPQEQAGAASASSLDPAAQVGPEPSAQAGTVSSTDASASIGAEFIDWVPGVGREAPEIAHTAARRAAETPSPAPAHPPARPQFQPGMRTPVRPGSAEQPPGPPQAPVSSGAAASAPVAPPSPPLAPSRPGGAPPDGYRPVMGAGQPSGGVVALPGLVCVNGHANSPERSRCRTCQAPLQGETRTVARPPLGTALISTGASFVLDRTAIIGRRPRASRVSEHEVPQLITVPSPQQDISRSHLELRLEGWHVVALDMGTTNGTTLLRPGMEPVRLRTREGVVLYDGDQLDLGDGIRIQFREAT